MSGWGERIGTVGDWMTRNPVAVSPETPVGEAARLMRTEGHVLVVDGDALVESPNRDIQAHARPPGDVSVRRPSPGS
jgi:CBS domain-containing protein